MILDQFHPIVREWFQTKFGEPTDAQAQGWPSIAGRRNTLIAAPTGSGKTLAAFMVCLDRLFRRWMAGSLRDATYVVYVSPLKALSNDIQRNLDTPLEEICNLAERRGLLPPQIRTAVRTGDTPSSERQAMVRRPPHILVTTPESLYLILTAPKARLTLQHVDTVIVDEIHALARDKRGSHLALTLERLNMACHERPVRIGLSATQKPIEEIAAFLVGSPAPDEPAATRCDIVDAGHRRDLDLQVVVPPTPLEAVCSNEQWGEVYEQLIELINSHRSTLVFVNTRRMAERVAHRLTESLGEEVITSHHGSLSKDIRHSAEQRLKAGQLKAIVATASLEMGIDIGYIDLVVQIGSSRSIANFLQRVGRSGHSLRATPKGRLMPLTRDELIECCALMRAIRKGVLDKIEIPEKPLDILAQQIVAEVATGDRDEEELFHLFRRAYPYRDLQRKEYDGVVEMLNRGLTRSIKNGAYLHRDPINGMLKARRGARIAAITSGGAIPDTAQYRVVTEGDKTFVGMLDEEFAFESLAGDVFLLGNTSWRIAYVRNGEVVVNDAQGQPPSIPFWFGESPGRTVELSSEISLLREEMAAQIVAADRDRIREKIKLPAMADGLLENSFDQLDAETVAWVESECLASRFAAMQAVRYVAAQQAAIGMVPTQKQIVFERFFDESGAMQLVVHSPLGTRINRAWGLAFRKRFCRSFDFELQASADDDGIVLSLGPQHSFPLEDMFRMLTIESGPKLLEQALLAVPMFGVRWRWNVTRALALLRFVGGKKVQPHMLRFRADDMLAAAFPDQVGCLENHGADIEYPDHPIVQQTLYDCMTEAMDIVRWKQMLIDVQDGRVEFVPRDTREPSPFAHERINANPYAFLDPAPAEERRTRAVATRRTLSTGEMKELGKLSYEAISTVRQEAWPVVRDSDELHDVLASIIVLSEAQASDWRPHFARLREQGRAVRFARPGGNPLWVALENLPVAQAVWPDGVAEPAIEVPASLQREIESHVARVEIIRGQVPYLGPFSADELSSQLDLPASSVFAACEALEAEGTVLRGQFYDNPQQTQETTQWCDRRLLARIHRLTISGLREQIRPTSPETYLRFLVRHHDLLRTTKNSGPRALRKSLEQLQGFQSAAGSWERSLLSGRIDDYDGQCLDELLASGEATWGRLRPPLPNGEEQKSMASLRKSLPMTIALRANLGWLLPTDHAPAEALARGNATDVLDALKQRGALFDQDLRILTKLLPTHLEEALRELAALGLITCDSLVGVREMVDDVLKKRKAKRRGAPTRTGRWSLFPGIVETPSSDEHAQNWCWLLLSRYGVVFRDVLTRESTAPPWWRLVACFRRMERRGEIRGGRFIADVAGEQYATEATIYSLRKLRNDESVDDWIAISAADPVNLFGVVTAGGRIPAISGNSLVIRNGQIVASKRSGKIDFHVEVAPDEIHEMTRGLHAGRRVPPRDIPLGMPRRRTTAG